MDTPWEELAWDKRILKLEGLTADEKGKVTNLILKLPNNDRESAVPNAKDVALTCLKDRLADAAAAAAGRVASEQPTGHPYKRVKISASPSELANPSVVESSKLIPKAGHVRPEVAFFTGRNHAVPLWEAPPVLLQAPEFGVVSDAAQGAPGCVEPQAKHFQAAVELCHLMAKVYDTEKLRQDEFLEWFRRSFSGLPQVEVPAPSSVMGADAAAMMSVSINGSAFVISLIQVRNHGGDAQHQALRCAQLLYGDGERWGRDPVLRASGGPVLVLELLGTCLTLHGAYTIEGNVMAAEPLTPRLLLLPLDDRQEQPGLQLARALAGLEAAMQLLQRRFQVMAGLDLPPPARIIRTGMLPLGMSADYRAALCTALDCATLVGEDARPAAERRGALALPAEAGAAGPPQHTWARLPYPLARGRVCPTVEHVPGYADRPLFTCMLPGLDGRVLVKFTRRQYPVEVHQRLAQLGLTSKLLDFVRLPGGWCMVVQEYLGDGWTSCSSLTREQQAQLLPQVKAVVSRMHQEQLDGSRAIVHGDLRPPNLMWHEGDNAVRVVDLDWAGPEGVARYPARMAGNILWHAGASPGQVLRKEHDLHLLGYFGQ